MDHNLCKGRDHSSEMGPHPMTTVGNQEIFVIHYKKKGRERRGEEVEGFSQEGWLEN